MPLKVLRAKTLEERTKGFLGHSELPKDTVMVFEEVRGGDLYHMRGMKFPIGIAAFGSNGEILGSKDMHPGMDTFSVPQGALVVIEGAPGFYNEES